MLSVRVAVEGESVVVVVVSAGFAIFLVRVDAFWSEESGSEMGD